MNDSGLTVVVVAARVVCGAADAAAEGACDSPDEIDDDAAGRLLS
jgi:hypothetical protein